MNKHFYLRKTCRLCDSANMNKVLELKPTALCDAYLKNKKEQEIYLLDLVQCQDCNFVQLECVVDPEIIYRDYIYVTTSSSGLSTHFQAYADTVCTNLNLKPDNLVIDIGSNDGTLLQCFKNNGAKVLGVEPSTKTAHDATSRGIQTLPEFFDPNLAKKIHEEVGSADLITVNNLFANIDDLFSFTQAAESLLSPEGVMVIESSYLADMVDNMVFDFIYHEHLSYFSILPLIKFFNRVNMHLIRIEHVGTKGGSLRYYWAKRSSSRAIHASVSEFVSKEQAMDINPSYFRNWSDKIQSLKQGLLAELQKHKGKKIAGYGASATSTTLIYHFDLQEKLELLIDDNPGKINTFSPGLHIPVKSFKAIQDEGVEVVVVLAWRYVEAIRSKLAGKKIELICPLPSVTTEKV